ncbi:hypothetical protein OIE69_43990 (plasmid) [Actinacidiphila glaucinigra]|uniref:hypothetical protein n=1 Tax=Actinacidiphila glaucinigra TaxID=235986 RepID=UPI002DDAA087|nr:hypothetical protein [Actinacidiphila glaucinigra]WSD65867.1 hypothetical protein OIE69_43990 [Actinacidiphila glaucinigra]
MTSYQGEDRMCRTPTVVRHLARAAVTACCVAALALTQAAQAHADSRTVNFDYQHLWITPEFKIGGGAIQFKVKKCNRPNGDMTVLLRRTDGFNYVVSSEKIRCRAGDKVVFNVGSNPAGTYEFELGKLDDYKFFKGSATYSFTSPR